MNEPIPYIVYEGTMVRFERTIKRLWILCIIMFTALVISNGMWLYYESQFVTVEATEVTQRNDGGYNNYIGNDGDIVNGYTDYQEDEVTPEESQR